MGSYEVTTTGGTYQIDTADEEAAPEKTLGGFAKNLGSDVSQTAKGLFGEGGLGQNLLEHPVDTATNVIKNIPSAVVNEGKRIGAGELLTGHPINAAEKFGQAAYEKPLTTALDVLPVAGTAGEALGIGGEGAKAADVASQAAKAAPEAATEEAAGIIPFGRTVGNTVAEEAGSQTPKITPQLAPEQTSPLQEVSDYLGGKYGEAQNVANKGYAKVAKQPGWSNTLADYLDRYAQDMSLKNIGGSVRQIRQMGPETGRALGQYAIENKYTAPGLGDIGLGKKISADLEAAGKQVGALRKEADTLRDATQNPIDVLQEVRSRLDPKYATGRGISSEEAGQYKRALEEVEDAQASHQGLADLSTKLNKYASDNKLKQATGAVSDVANVVTEVNNNRIRTLLGPEKAAQYDNALKQFGALKKMDAMHDFKEAREAAGRLGPGGSVRHMAQHFLDQYGYRAGAQIANRLSKVMRSNPQAAGTLPSVFKEFVNQIEDLLPDEGMAHGGIVEDDLQDFLASKYEKKEKQ